jgi:hypothetical protein
LCLRAFVSSWNQGAKLDALSALLEELVTLAD